MVTKWALVPLTVLLLIKTTTSWANDALIYYNSNTTSSQYSNLKSELEDAGFTVTGSTSTTVSSNDVSGQDLVIDIAGNSNCGSTCRSVYDTYVSGGGKLIIAGQYGASNRNINIEALIENKMGVGSMTLVGGCNGCNGSVARDDYASSTASENTLPGSDLLIIASGGTPMASNSSTSNYHSWYKWDYGSNGGSVVVTYGYIQLLSNHTYASNMGDFLYRTLQEEGLITTVTYTSSISNAQQTSVNTSRGVTHSGNGIYVEQVGVNNELTIIQDGKDNLIAGKNSTTNSYVKAEIDGNNNTTTMTQRGENNVILFGINGDYNTTTVTQGDAATADDNRAEFLIGGDFNTTSITQKHNNTGTDGHYIAIGVAGNNNNVLTSQTNDGEKIGFISITGDDNDIDLNQQGTGDNYAEIVVGSDQTVDVTQDGSGNHNASISMSGYTSGLDLTQDSSTNQTYSINQTCVNANGCGTTTITQN